MQSRKSVSEPILKKEPTPSRFRQLLHRFVPANFNNVFGLAQRLLFEGKAAGRVAMVYSAAGLLLTPLDVVLQVFEQRRYKTAPPSQLPQLFVCGAPRSGTTVTAQVLIKHLPVYYFNNLTSLFPRAPITASKLFGWLAKTEKEELPLDSFYGRTTRLSFPNDALYFWDRWTGNDRTQIPQAFDPETQQAIAQFFNAVEAYAGQPLVNKNNSLNTYASLVAQALPNAYFICLDRDPLFLAQSHYVARQFIHGDAHIPYGIHGDISPTEDPIEDICQQVRFHQDRMKAQQARIGSDRFIILPYEDFCARPAYWVSKFSKEILGRPLDEAKLKKTLPPLKAANKRKIDPATFSAMEKALTGLSTVQNP